MTFDLNTYDSSNPSHLHELLRLFGRISATGAIDSLKTWIEGRIENILNYRFFSINDFDIKDDMIIISGTTTDRCGDTDHDNFMIPFSAIENGETLDKFLADLRESRKTAEEKAAEARKAAAALQNEANRRALYESLAKEYGPKI